MSSTAISSSSSSSSSTIDTYVIGLNAALQKRFVIDSIKDEDIIPGNVYRASSISYGVGGKGQDVAYTLNCLQYHSGGSRDDDTAEQQQQQQGEQQQTPPFHLVQFIGTGYEGDMVYNKMSKDFLSSSSVSASCLSASGLSATTVRTTSILRTCTSIVTQASTTELIDPSGIIASEEINELLDKIQQTASASSLSSTSSTNNIQSMCFMGSMPPGCSSDLYSKIYHTIVTATTDTASPTQHRQVLCFIDSVVGLNELLQQISHTSSPATTTTSTILKINVAELCRYVNVPIQKESDGVRVESVVDAMAQFWQQQQLLQSSSVTTPLQPNVIALTNGAHPAYLAVLKSPPESSSLPLSFDLYRLPIASPFSVDSDDCSGSNNNNNNNYDPHSSTLYPIGAGDAVAAGTFAAWNYYVATSSSQTSDDTTGCDQIKNDPILPQAIRDALDHDRSMWHQNETNSATSKVDNDELYISCFRFGLACGSASCRQEENSIVSVPHVLQLFKNDNNNNNNDPAVAYSTKSTHSIPINVSAVTATSVV